jgi:hypothetical protein
VKALYRRALLREPHEAECESAVNFIRQADKPAPSPFSWRYGYASVTAAPKGWTLGEFTPMAHLNKERNMWTPGPQMPMHPWGHLLLQPGSGHPGLNAASVMRWTCPFDSAELRISGTLKRTSERGNGIRALIFSSRTGLLKEVVAAPGKGTQPLETTLKAQAGDVLSFVVDSMGSTDSDGYSWAPQIHRVQDGGPSTLVTRSDEDWCDASGWPLKRVKPQSGVAQLAQVLLMSNEFMFVD